MNKNYLSLPLSPEELKKEEERKKKETQKRMYPPLLIRLKEKPTEREILNDRAKPLSQRKFYPAKWEVTHEIRRRNGDTIQWNENGRNAENEQFADTAVPVTAPNNNAKNTPIKQRENTAGKVGGILRWAGNVAKRLLPKKR